MNPIHLLSANHRMLEGWMRYDVGGHIDLLGSQLSPRSQEDSDTEEEEDSTDGRRHSNWHLFEV